MGIKNLHYLLKKYCPQVYTTVPLSKYAFKKIAIDLSIFMYRYKTTYGEQWLQGFLQMITVLRYNDIHFIVVYDSKAPPEKDNERKSRIEERAKNRQRVEKLEQAWQRFQEEYGYDTPVTLNTTTDRDETFALFIHKLLDTLHTDDIAPAIIDSELLKLRQSSMNIRSEDFELTKKLFHICGIPYIVAQGEAEATCAALNSQGYVSGVLTDDTDVLAYGSPIMLCKIDFTTNTCVELDFCEILEELRLTSQEFIDLCILCGTDYNTNLTKINCDKAYRWIQQYHSLEEIENNNPSLSFAPLNYHRIREIFQQPYTFPPDIAPFCDFPSRPDLEDFCRTYNCSSDIHSIMNACCFSQYHEFDIDEKENSEK